MDMSRIEAINDWSWRVKHASTAAGAEAILYGDRELVAAMDDKVIEQLSNVAQLPGLVGAAYAMPDAHWGYGFPIGGVAAFDPARGGIVSAGGVGFDISCGIRCLRTSLTFNDLVPHLPRLADRLLREIPAGVGVEGKLHLARADLDDIMREGAGWAIRHRYGDLADLPFIEERGCVPGADPMAVSPHAKQRQRGEMGTLGSGNHYLEVQMVDRIDDERTAAAFGLSTGQIVVSIHCGSRGLGHQIGTDYLVSLAKAAGRLGIVLPDRELACAPIESPEGQQYLGAMNAATNVALANRQILAAMTRRVFAHFFPHARLETLFDVSHNTCKVEEHDVAGHRRRLYVHRKGATRAFGPGHPDLPDRYRDVGQPVIIGGSMGTGSYVLAGTTASEERAFGSASHGAGRLMSRHQALRQWRGRELIDQLRERGILIRTHSMRGAAEEAPGAYKDVDAVARATERAGLARRVAFLRPKICVKG